MGEACSDFDLKVSNETTPPNRSPAWYAVQTAYRREQQVDQALNAKGYRTYLPLIREIHQWNDRRKIIHVPAFSGYLFVHHEPTLRNRVGVLQTGGVIRLLSGNHAPNPVPDSEIEAVRRALNSGMLCQRCDGIAPSTRVRVTRGPLAGVEGRLERIKSSFRLIITVSVFSQSISAEVGINDVEAIHEGSNTH